MNHEKIYLYKPLSGISTKFPSEYTISSTGESIEMLAGKLSNAYLTSNYDLDFSILVLFFNELASSAKGRDVLGDSFSFKTIVSKLKVDFSKEYLLQLDKDVKNSSLFNEISLTKLKECTKIAENSFLFILRECLTTYSKIGNNIKLAQEQSKLLQQIKKHLVSNKLDVYLCPLFGKVMQKLYSSFERTLLEKCKYSNSKISEKESIRNVCLEKSVNRIIECLNSED